MARGTDNEIVRKAQEGDAPALAFLWRRHRRWLAAVLLAHAPRESDLEDLLQDVAVALIEKVAELRDPARLRPWLRTVAVNVARLAGRKSVRRRRIMRSVREGDLERAYASYEPNQAPEQTYRDLKRALRAVETLPPEYQEPLFLRSVRGLSQKEIADLLSLPVTTVETRLARARRMLRERLHPRRTEAGFAPK